MHLGQMITTGTPEEIRNDETVQRIYLGEAES
jgi:ABC-type branched-subunit amino acid transport system ATPase component